MRVSVVVGVLLLASCLVLSQAASLSESTEHAEESSEVAEPVVDRTDEQIPASPSRGGRITLISNVNTLRHVQGAPKFVDNEAVQESTEKMQAEEKQKHSSEEALKSGKEEHNKQEETDEANTKKAAEEKQKQAIQEAADKKAAEEKQKQEEADAKAKAKAEEQKQKQDEAEAKKVAEQKDKKDKADEEAKKKSDEETKKKQDEEAKKKADEQKAKDDVGVQLTDGWTNYQNSYEVAHCVVWQRYVKIHGLVRGYNGLVAIIGERCRPRGGRLIFTGMRGRETRVDVADDGRIYMVTSGDGSDWLSLDNIQYDRDIQNYLSLGGGKYPYGSGYRQPSISEVGNICALSGLVAGSQGGHYCGILGQCNPGQYMMFTANNHDNTIGLYLHPNGNFYHHDTGINHGWVALDGIMWSASVSGWLSLYNGWYNYGGGWRNAFYYRSGSICLLGGLLGASFNSHITNLPPGCRPRARLIFPVHNPGRACRVDVTPDGNVYYISYGTSSWMSLSNIQFIAYN